jgi:hypothetical protein
MNSPLIAKVRTLLHAPIERHYGTRPMHHRFAIPYSFKPELSVPEALIAAFGAFLRIFLGSILFGVYGWNSLVRWNAIRSTFWKVVAVPPIILLFVLLFTLLMAAISAMVRKLLVR